MLDERFASMLEARDVEDFRGRVLRFTKRLGFDFVSAVVVIDRPQGEPEFLVVDNAPSAYRPVMDDLKAARMDPVMQHCKHHSTPIVWDRQTYVNGGQPEMWEEQAAHGYRAGICFAQHLPRGRHFIVGVDRDQPLPRDRRQQARVAADLCLFAACAQDAALRLLAPQCVEGEVQVRLAPLAYSLIAASRGGSQSLPPGSCIPS